MSDPAARRSGIGPCLSVGLAFLISRVFYALAGVRFETNLVQFNFQFMDVDLMKHRLAESLWYYHMQPPLHNLMVGLIVKAFPNNYGPPLHILFMAMGLASAFLLYRLMRILKVPAWLASTVTILFVVSPGCVLFENFPMYEYPIMLLLLGQSVALYELLRNPRWGWSLLFFSLLAALALLRAFYHLAYLVAVAAALAIYFKTNRKMILATSALPILLVFALFTKNLMLFGFFGSSSWGGNNLPTVTTHNLTPEECKSLVAAGKLDPFGCIEGASPPEAYRAWIAPRKPTGIPVLDQERKSTGEVNLNNSIYLETGPRYTQTALQVLRYYPQAYLRSVAIAWFCYFRPPDDFFQFEENRARISGLARLSDLLLFGEWRQASGKELRSLQARGGSASLLLYTGIFLIVAIPAILLATAILWFHDWRLGENSRIRLYVIAFMVLQIVMVAGIANFLSSFENNRYRFPTDPLYLALAAMLIARAWSRIRTPARSRLID